MTRVVHCQKEKFDIYIGRRSLQYGLPQSKWANPFKIGRDGTRKQVIEKYRQWIMGNKKLLREISELKDKVLGCWCKPNDGFNGQVLCHGQILGSLAENCDPKEIS